LKIGTVKGFKTCLLFDHSLSLGYTFKNTISDNDNLDLGLKISFYRLFLENKLIEKNIIPEYQDNDYSFKDKHSYGEWGFAIGMKYRLENMQIGLAYERGKDFNKKAKKYYQMGRLPDKWSAGILLNLSRRVKTAGGFNYLAWNNPNIDATKNQVESYGSIIYHFFKELNFSAGFFHTNCRDRGSSDLLTDRYNAWYFTAGFLYSLKFVDVDLALADSHLFSGEWRKQTIIKIGLGYRIK
jgi:predicted porin